MMNDLATYSEYSGMVYILKKSRHENNQVP
jgi:hypothetical protein